jgi:hypothetical protein
MSTTHTSGPWRTNGFAIDSETSRRDYGHKYKPDMRSRPVAQIISVSGEDEENKANARLIAAAPELLEALQDAMKVAIHEEHPFRSWHNKAKAAIAKATGTNA